SSLRQFTKFLSENNHIEENPFDLLASKAILSEQNDRDYWPDAIIQFKRYLLGKKINNPVTLKNYLSDVKRFIEWYEKSFNTTFEPSHISEDTLRLYQEANGAPISSSGAINNLEKMSPSSLKRRLS